MRQLFEFLSIFDWVTPVAAILEDLEHGGPFDMDKWTFYIPHDAAIGKGWSGADVLNLMQENGIATWGSLLHFGEFFFTVPLEQAAWAEYILNKYSVPICPKSQGAPRPGKKRTILDMLFGELK